MFKYLFNYIYQLSDIKIFLIVICFSIIVSLVAILIVNKYIPLNLRYTDNPAIGNTSALVSSIYGVLAGLMCLYLINNNNFASDAVQHEANSAANIYRDSNWLKEPTRSHIQIFIKNYLTKVINKEWPQMEKGQEIDNEDDLIIDRIANELKSYTIINYSEQLIARDLVEEIKLLYDARHQRIQLSSTSLSVEIWVVILISTVLVLFISYLFGVNFKLHIVMLISASLMTSSVMFLLITLDTPFEGEFIVDPGPLQAVLKHVTNTASLHKSLDNRGLNKF